MLRTIAPPSHPRIAALMALAIVAGCGAESSSGIGADFDVEALPALRLVEEFRIGSVDDPDYGFSSVESAVLDRDGQTFVFESQESRFRVYGEDGSLVRTIGGPGQGPGEFTPGPFISLSWGLRGDTLWVVDRTMRRLTFFNRAGEVLSTARFADVLLGVESGYPHMIQPKAMDEEGLLIGGLPPEVSLPSQLGFEDSIPVARVRFDPSGAVVDTAGWTAHRAWADYTPVSIDGQEVEVAFPLPSGPLAIELTDGHFTVLRPVAESAEEGRFTVSKSRFNGEVEFVRTYRYKPASYTESAVDYVVGRTARWSRVGGDSATVHRQIRSSLEVPAFQPPIQRVHLAADEGLWLRREDGGDGHFRWILLDPDGRPRGVVTLPAERFAITWSEGDRILVIEQDEMGIPWVVRYRLVEGEEDG